ncbi:polysaccharide deacetylase family protein [Sinosporangium siamense]|uniref:NodB homology domain-containing protein n=1 Tax=Sinosporangium siamense TaxID=1367973 RepID=A0A919RKC6_9ACTN|nr:polysaccharide deacetylase family protein [Sinosporangium siamense]GII93504.1 hypothetical protein Ssi02_37350 [Sinosporangium siamense]
MRKLLGIGGLALIAITSVAYGVTASPAEPESTIPSDPTITGAVDPGRVDGLSTRTITEEHKGRHVYITYPVLKGARALNDRLRDEVTGRLQAFSDRNPQANRIPYPEFNVDWRFAAFSAAVVGVRLRTGEFTGSGWTNSYRTIWYDRASRRPLDSTDLLAESADLGALAEHVRGAFGARTDYVDLDAVTSDKSLFDSLTFNHRGDLVVEFDDYQVASGAMGRVAAAVPFDKVKSLLSPAGHQAREAVMRDSATRPSLPYTSLSEAVKAAEHNHPPAVSNRAGTVDCREAKCVALAFDDGPGENTGRLLDTLAEHKARATFFTVGASAVAYPELLRRMHDEGHLIGNHSWSHRTFSALSPSKIADELDRTQDAVAAAIGRRPTIMRAPYGSTGDKVVDAARDQGLAVVSGDLHNVDLEKSTPSAIADDVVERARPGAVISMHDVYSPSVEALPTILSRLRDRGFTFVTIPELYGSRPMEPGEVYQAGPPTEDDSQSIW